MIRGDRIVATESRLADETYVLHFGPPRCLESKVIVRTDSIATWHRRLGHVGVERIKQLLKDLNVKCPNDEEVKCDACPAGRVRHSSHHFSTRQLTKEPGTIHLDLSGVINKASIKGYRHYILCKDEATDFDLVYFCKSKAEVPSLLAKLLIDFEAACGAPV